MRYIFVTQWYLSLVSRPYHILLVQVKRCDAALPWVPCVKLAGLSPSITEVPTTSCEDAETFGAMGCDRFDSLFPEDSEVN